MAQRHRVRCIVKTGQTEPWSCIAAIGGLNMNNTPWRVSVAEAIAGMEAEQWAFYVLRHGRQVDLVVAEQDGHRYLKAGRDGIEPKGLLQLPECQVRER
ncbi:MAG: DUF3892 domain-containing protein [Armatimonadetes bacterium]|nr:DUF3892 domain-containing protein [Armatimonadota bacterium]